MKLILKNTNSLANQKFEITRKEMPCLDSSWHYHAQYELIYITKSHGIRFVGDNVAQFYPGDLVLVGPYLPHLWRNDASFYQDHTASEVNTIILKFTKDFIGEGTFNNPEFTHINDLLEQAKFGVSFGSSISNKYHHDLSSILKLSPAEQSIKLLSLLSDLAVTADCETLSSSDMRQYTTADSSRLDSILKYISDNYTEDISLKDVSDVACMTTNSFCRFFKKKTNKSFTGFLNEVRIRNASRLLVQDTAQISDIGYKVGYKSITNFNKQFKQIMGCTPQSYRQQTA